MATKYWLKFYYEVIDDPKMGRLPDNLWRRFFECCALAGELDQSGRLPSLSDISWRLRVDTGTLETEFEQLARIDLLDYRADNVLDGHWVVTNFEKRQSAMSKAEFMRRKRDEERKDHYYDVTNTVTISNTDKDIDKDIDKEANDNLYQELLTAFINLSQLPLFGNPKPRDNDTLNEWVANECTISDIQEAINYASENGLTIVSPASIRKGVMIARSNRLRQPTKETYADKLTKAGYRD